MSLDGRSEPLRPTDGGGSRSVVAVLGGGRSPEHDVSLQSAAQLVAHIDRARWTPLVVLLDRTTSLWRIRPDVSSLPVSASEVFDGASRWPGLHPGRALAELQETHGVAIVFPALHGPRGEDGSIQGMCALADLACVGSDLAASATALDKIRTRECLQHAGLPLAEAFVSRERLQHVDPRKVAAEVGTSIGYPCFAKIDQSGSSLGVAHVASADALIDFLAENRARGGRRFIAERPVVGEEISVPVLGNADEALRALTPVGIYPTLAEHFSYEAKYLDGGSQETVPPRGLNAAMIAEVQDLAKRCHRALQCDGMSRTDMIVSATGPVILEVNTIPGLTPASLLPKAAAYDGLSFADLIDSLIEAGLRRAGQRQ